MSALHDALDAIDAERSELQMRLEAFVSEDTDARPPPPSKWNVTVTHQWRPMPAPTPPPSPIRQVCAIGTAAAIFFGGLVGVVATLAADRLRRAIGGGR